MPLSLIQLMVEGMTFKRW